MLFSFDVSQAFAIGMTFNELSALAGAEIREVEFDMPRACLGCLRQLPDFRDYDPGGETFTMLKPMYGLKDAPRVWRKKLHQVWIQWMLCRQCYVEPEFYCVRRGGCSRTTNAYQRAIEHNQEQPEIGTTRNTKAQADCVCTMLRAPRVET